MVGHERHQSYLPGPLDGAPECPLVFGADTGAAAGFDLSPLRNEPADLIDLFVVDVGDLFHAERANLAPAHEAPTRTATGSARATGSSTWAPATTSKSGWSAGSAWASWGFCGHASSSPFGIAGDIYRPNLEW